MPDIYRPIFAKLKNVAPLCTVETKGWTGSTSGEVLFTGDGTTKDFSGKVDLPPVNPLSSFVLHYTIGGTTYDATADENGNITGTHITSGTINQDGTYEIHFDTAPDNGTDVTADYDYGIAPANLENVLDPNNPNPSGWGWKTTTGAGSHGFLIITLPQKGVYLLGGRIETLLVSGTASNENMIWQIFDPISNTYLSITSSGIWVGISSRSEVLNPLFVTQSIEKVRLQFYSPDAREAKFRIWELNVFRIA